MNYSATKQSPATSLPTLGDLRSLPLPWITLGMTALSVALLFSTTMTSVFQFDRESIALGQVWRILTGHLTHWNLDHLVWDAAVFAVLGSLCEWRNPLRTISCIMASAISISLSVWWLSPEFVTYRGLSGIDSALFTLLACTILAEKWADREWRWVTIIGGLMLGLAAKVAFELLAGETVFVNSTVADFEPVVLAHVVGALVGIVVAAWPSRNGAGGRKLE